MRQIRLTGLTWAGALAVCALVVAGCGGSARPVVPTQAPAALPQQAAPAAATPETLPAAGQAPAAGGATPASSMAVTATVGPAATAAATSAPANAVSAMTDMTTTLPATSQAAPAPVVAKPTLAPDVLYQADFLDKKSGWPDNLKFDNYYVGYHEPDNYHVEVHTPNDNAIVVIPGHTFDNFAVESQIFTNVPSTAPTGDFRYGLVFRRSGNHYYAFVLSPRTKTWYVLKNGGAGLQVLGQGKQDSIQGLQAADLLRVNAQGPSLDFFINNQTVAQLSDSDYTNGDIGFYVETFDSPKAHIHFHSLTVRKAQKPLPPVLPTCTVASQYLNMRRGPSVYYDPPIATLSNGTRMQALGRSPDQWWIRVRVADTGQQGWVSSLDAFVTCDVPVANMPVFNPSTTTP